MDKKSLKVPFTIYADLECLLENMHPCQNNLEKYKNYLYWVILLFAVP